MRTLEGNWKEASELPPRAENNGPLRDLTLEEIRSIHSVSGPSTSSDGFQTPEEQEADFVRRWNEERRQEWREAQEQCSSSTGNPHNITREHVSAIGRDGYNSISMWEADLGNISGDEGVGEICNDSSFDETVTPNERIELRPVQAGANVTAVQRIIEEGLFHQIMIAFDRMIHSHNMIFGSPQDIERFMSTHLLRNIRGLHNLTLTVVDGTVSCEVGCREQIEMTFDVGINRFPVGRIILDSLNNTARINSQNPFGRMIMASFQERDAPEGWGVQVSVEAERERIDVNYTGSYNSFPGRQLS